MPYCYNEDCDRYNEYWDSADFNQCPSCNGQNGRLFNHIPTWYRDPVGKGPYFYGLELELEHDRGSDADTDRVCCNIQDAMDDKEFITYKSDGSLDYGIEFVSRPASAKLVKENWTQLIGIASANMEAMSSCGLHIHVSRKPLTEMQTAKIVCFVNARGNHEFITAIAGRIGDQWGERHHKELKDGNKRNSNRYEAVNLRNRDTIEFRIFAATLNSNRFLARFEFVQSLVMFTMPASRSLKTAMDRIEYMKFVHDERTYKDGKSTLRWPNLVAWIDAKWLGIETAITQKLGIAVSGNRRRNLEINKLNIREVK